MKKLAFLFLLAAMTSCTPGTTETTDSPETNSDDTTLVPEIEKSTYPQDRKFDDFANHIAGIEGEEGSGLKGLESSITWQNYKRAMDGLWKTTNDKLPVMKDWSNAEVNQGSGTLFYPFSGPDFLHADAFFPEHENIVMIALEPIGTFPNMVEKSEAGKDGIYLNGVRKSLNMILGISFFRTIAMVADFKGEVDGNLPVLMQFMKRTNHEIMYQEVVAMKPDGTLTTDMSNNVDSTYIGNRYYFKRNESDVVRTLTYFAVNLQNTPYVSRGGLVAKGLKTRTDLVAFLEGIDIKSTYLKSASYLMHRSTFSIIRNIILDNSEFVLQDDSGIPIQYFGQRKWDLTFYGDYKFPISLFAERHQEDLKDVYLKGGENVKSLPFGIGYQFRKGTSNLMKAEKK
ncbi:MAG: hypothetical protein P8H43_03655 [Crocinitomicaceae bacterium]|jgi:hypothetical protein|nr:hypothetical protein [Crocinitomicaceae bacterium]MDG1741650.1 hypothetical protein [Crocinitomicaceae bacterium]